MRKITVFLMTLVGLCAAAAAQPTIQAGAVGRNIEAATLKNAVYVTRLADADCWLVREGRQRKDDGGWRLVTLDGNLSVKNSMPLPVSAASELVTWRQGLGRVHLIMVDSSDARRTTVVGFSVMLDSMTLRFNHVDTLATYDYRPGDACLVWGGTSPGGEYMGVMAVVEYRRIRKYRAEGMMYSSELEQLWKRECAVGTLSSVAVSDEGELLTLGEERENGEEHFYFSILTARRGSSYEVTVACDRVKDLQILGFVGRRAVCAGLVVPDGHDAVAVSGLGTMAFDVDSCDMTHFAIRNFQNEDLCVMLNKKTKKVQRDGVVRMVSPIGWTATGTGFLYALGHRHRLQYVNANGTVENTFSACGINLVSVNGDGEVEWVRNVRRNDSQKGADDRLFVALLPTDDGALVLKSESKKEPAKYDIAKEARDYEVGDKCNLVMYRIGAEGDVAKTVLVKKSPFVLLNAARREDGSVALLSMDGNKSQMVNLTL